MVESGADDDTEAVRRVLAGDREAFGVLVARYGRRLHDLARRMLCDASEADDAVQQAFLNAFRALDRFDPRRPFRHWLLRITTNLCRNRLAARRHRPVPTGVGVEDDGIAREPAARGDEMPAGSSDVRADAERVRGALEALPETYRLAAVLRYVHGLDIAEIAEITDDPVPTVKTHLHRARAALAVALGSAEASAPSHEQPRTDGETGRGRAGTAG